MSYKFKNLKRPVFSQEFWYDISSGGYLSPEDFSDDPDTIQAIEDAVNLLVKCESMTGTRSLATFKSWLPSLGLTMDDVILVNASDRITVSTVSLRVGDMNLDRLRFLVAQHDKYIALGDYAANALRRVTPRDFRKLPHPSGLNRLLNDKMYLTAVLNWCKIYLHE